MPKVLIASPNEDWSGQLKNFFKDHRYDADICQNGKETQLSIFRNKYIAVILDLEITNNSSLEVIRYIQTAHPSLKTVLSIFNTDLLEKMDISEDELKKMGASSVLIKPENDLIIASVEGKSIFSQWKTIVPSKNQTSEEVEVEASDEEFTKIKITDYLSGNTAIFDLFIKLKEAKYIKILNRGDFFEPDRIKKYRDEKNVEYLYFKISDRSTYVNFMNDLLGKLAKAKGVSGELKIKTTKNLIEKYVEEIYLEGIKPILIEEGAQICENVYGMIQNDPDLWKTLRGMIEYDESFQSHLFMVSLFSTVTCSNLEWSSPSTVDKIAFGAMVHDIGKIKISKELLHKSREEMSPDEFAEYRMHPQYGAELLRQYPSISSQVIQIVEQHHEWSNGEGFPKGLSGIKIFPLAKVVSLSNDISEYLVKNKLTPLEGLKHFIRNREIYVRYDAQVLKAFVKGFSDPAKIKD